MANALFELEDYDEAMHYFQKVAEASPDDPLPLEKIAQIYEAQGKMPQGAELAYQTAELHLKAKDIDKAIENWTRSIKMNPGNLRARTRLAMSYERMGRKSQAVIHWQ
jgi:tetratricopeptide (TPR) repeat protein